MSYLKNVLFIRKEYNNTTVLFKFKIESDNNYFDNLCARINV